MPFCMQLVKEFEFTYHTKCDVEVISHLYANGGSENVAKSLDGEFAFCLMDVEDKKIIIARDPYGVRPLFRLRSTEGQLAICSESKVNIIDIIFIYN